MKQGDFLGCQVESIACIENERTIHFLSQACTKVTKELVVLEAVADKDL
jgi:uncharacterized protein YwlG (UPF0340 family)